MESQQKEQLEVPVSRYFPITHLVTDDVFSTQTGCLGMVIELKGVCFDTCDNALIHSYRHSWHQALLGLNEDIALYVHGLRSAFSTQLEGKASAYFTQKVHEGYNQSLSKVPTFSNRLYITLLIQVHQPNNRGLLGYLSQLLQSRQWIEKRHAIYHHQLSLLQLASQQLCAQLADFKPQVLKQDSGQKGAQLLSFLASFINGPQPFQYSAIDDRGPLIHGVDDFNIQSTAGYLGQYLPRYRLFFGNQIEFYCGHGPSYYATMLSVKDYGGISTPLMFDGLLSLGCELINTHAFLKARGLKMQHKINQQIIKLENSNDPALSQIDQLSLCKDRLASGDMSIGYHYHSLMLMHQDIDQLKNAVHQVVQMYADLSYVVIEENLGQEAAFWAQMPGNQKYMVRTSLVTSQNFVDFAPLHAYEQGDYGKNHLGQALSILKTPAKTPIYFNFHASGSGQKQDLTPGHTAIIGGNGSGKTVFMGFMDTQMDRYGGQSYFFDRDLGLKIYIKACDGLYHSLDPNQPGIFNPFSLDDTPGNRFFLKHWLSQLVCRTDEFEPDAQVVAQLSSCVDYAYEVLVPADRQLSHIIKILPVDFSRWPEMNRWVKDNPSAQSGYLSFLFDNPTDEWTTDQVKCGFDMSYLLNQSPTISHPVMMYIFYRIEQSLHGQRVSLYLDEGWMYLSHPYWAQKLKAWLPTLRKLNCHLVLATQSLQSILDSKLRAQFLDNCATCVFFPNPQADFSRHYQHLNVTKGEFDFIKNTPISSRYFLYKQAFKSAICHLDLSPLKEWLWVFSGHKSSVRLMEDIFEQHGPKAQNWLPMFIQAIQDKEN